VRTTAENSERLPVTGVVLAGGRSQRMGTDKALVSVGGEPLVTRAAFALADVCEHVMVAAGAAEALSGAELPPEALLLADTVPFQGPLGGLATALEAAQTQWIFAVGVDMPFLHAEIARVLWEELAACPDPDAVSVVMPVGEAGAEPLLSLYRVDCLDVINRVLAEGLHRVIDICPLVGVLEVPLGKLEGVDPELMSLINVNTAEDLASARSVAKTHRSRSKTKGATRP